MRTSPDSLKCTHCTLKLGPCLCDALVSLTVLLGDGVELTQLLFLCAVKIVPLPS